MSPRTAMPKAAPKMRLPAVSEREFMAQVTDIAAIYSWEWVHFRPAQTNHGWRTPVSGTLGTGWPDLLLAKGDRVIAAELKAVGAKPTLDQYRVLHVLETGGLETFVWWPSDLADIRDILAGATAEDRADDAAATEATKGRWR